MIHDMVRHEQMWDPDRKANGRAVASPTTALRARLVIDSPATKLSLTKLRPRRALLCFT